MSPHTQDDLDRMLTRLKLTAVRDQLDSLLDEAVRSAIAAALGSTIRIMSAALSVSAFHFAPSRRIATTYSAVARARKSHRRSFVPSWKIGTFS